jgi:hypothetical protein
LRLPLWDPPSVLRRLGEGIHVALPAELPEMRVGSGTKDVDVQIDHASIAPMHATLERLDESLMVRAAGTGEAFEFDTRTETFRQRDRFLVNVGDQFALGTLRLMALEVRMASLVPMLLHHVGPDGHVRIDGVLTAIAGARPIAISAKDSTSKEELIRSIHAASPRREYPLTFLERLPTTPETIDAVSTAGACGMMVIDLRAGEAPTSAFLEALTSGRYQIWPCIVVDPLAPHAAAVAELNPYWL